MIAADLPTTVLVILGGDVSPRTSKRVCTLAGPLTRLPGVGMLEGIECARNMVNGLVMLGEVRDGSWTAPTVAESIATTLRDRRRNFPKLCWGRATDAQIDAVSAMAAAAWMRLERELARRAQ